MKLSRTASVGLKELWMNANFYLKILFFIHFKFYHVNFKIWIWINNSTHFNMWSQKYLFPTCSLVAFHFVNDINTFHWRITNKRKCEICDNIPILFHDNPVIALKPSEGFYIWGWRNDHCRWPVFRDLSIDVVRLVACNWL